MGRELQTINRSSAGRLVGARGLTEQQRAIVQAFSEAGTVTEAAKLVGCSAKTASSTLRLEHVQAALRGECQVMLKQSVPLALGVLLGIVKHGELAYTRLGLDAAKALLDRAGVVPQKAGEGRQGDKRDLSDLSPAELAAFIQQGQERQRQARAVDTEGTVSAPGGDLDPG